MALPSIDGARGRARLARAWLGPPDEAITVGRFRLRPEQRAAVGQIERAIARERGALLADPPGTGKTVVALAVARRYPDTLVIGPASLRDQWLRAAGRAAVRIRFVSLEALSRDADPGPAPLVIVDEAHHLRTPGTRRYARVAALTVDSALLLLTATPVVNGARDRDALLALIAGGSAPALDDEVISRLIIRREGGRASLPGVERLPPLPLAAQPAGIGRAIGALPPPFPAADGAAALALIRVTLALAWASSLAALDAALRRRLQRGAALADVLAENRWPTHAMLQRWVIGDDATQLAFPLVETANAAPPPHDALPTLRVHLAAVARLRDLVGPAVRRDSARRAAELQRLCAQHPGERVVVVARHADTVRALWNALRKVAGTVAVTGARVHAAAGRWTRQDVLRAVGPQARPWNPTDPRGVRMVLATDLLAEGVELQGARILVHGDGAWTPARIEQRVGRLVRLGAATQVVFVTQFRSPRGARGLLRLAERLATKSRARTQATAVARATEALERRLRPWLEADGAPEPRRVSPRDPSDGFLAVVTIGDHRHLVAGRRVGGRWQLSESPVFVARLAPLAECDGLRASPSLERDARRALSRWMRGLAARTALGRPLGNDASIWRAVQGRVDRALARASIERRTTQASEVRAALARLDVWRGAGVTRALRALLRRHPDAEAFARGLIEFAAAGVRRPLGHGAQRVPRPRLAALLVFSAARCAPRATSPESAAPRRSAPARSPSCPRCPGAAAAAPSPPTP